MASEYIEREAAIEAAIDAADEWDGGYNPRRAAQIRDGVKAIPAADVVERKHGKWEMKDDPYGFFDEIPVCSICGRTTKMRETYKFCPNCGAWMEES